MTDEASAISGFNNAASASASKKAGASLANDFNQFLTLLTTQLANQDPLSPMDTTEFTNQLVLFAGVEQQIASNENLENLISLSGGNQAVQAVSYIGKRVEANGNIFQLTEDGAEIGYDLATEAQTATLLIFDENDQLVRLESVDVEAGSHSFIWDGTNADGVQLDPGAYSFAVSAIDEDDAGVDVETSVTGVVDGVEVREEGVVLTVGKTEMLLDNVFGVREAVSGNGDTGEGA